MAVQRSSETIGTIAAALAKAQEETLLYRAMEDDIVAQVLRRLRRICAQYGSTPTFVLASATVSEPARSAAS